jgi:RNA-directed DNA polymerase
MTNGTSSSDLVSTKVRRIAELARHMPGAQLTTLSHHIDLHWMREAYRLTRKDGAVGVDRVTSKEYELDLEGNLASLLERIKKGTYRAPPVRRVNIPKGDGKSTRPIGIPTLEDKVAQRAIEMVLSAVFEEDFHEFSYGFRRGRGAHDAIRKLRENVIEMKGAVVVELDISKFFDTLG